MNIELTEAERAAVEPVIVKIGHFMVHQMGHDGYAPQNCSACRFVGPIIALALARAAGCDYAREGRADCTAWWAENRPDGITHKCPPCTRIAELEAALAT